MKALILWILRLLGFRKEVAAVEAYQAEAQKERQEAQEQTRQYIQEVAHEVEQEKQRVADADPADLDAEFERLRQRADQHRGD